MNAHEILDMIGDAKGDYLLQAQTYREENAEPQGKRISIKRVVLIAAMIALALLLVGCTVVYVLSLQDMAIGEHNYTPSQQEGNQEKTTTIISLQNVNQAALSEWLAFTERYDTDGTLAAANDRNESQIPEPYHLTYACYTWEMVDALDEIIEKYDLKLLEPYIVVQQGEEDILFDALKIENIHREEAAAEVSYNSGYFYPEGTFSINAEITLTEGAWGYTNLVSVRYSLKEYFDPVPGAIGDIGSYTQWNYTTGDGTTVLLAMNADSARIYADMEDAFLSIQMNAYGYEGRDEVAMPAEALEQVAEVFDYHVKTQYADLNLVQQMQAELAAREEAEAAAEQAEEDAILAQGYEAYLRYKLEAQTGRGQEAPYCTLYDLNGDGLEELLIQDRYGYCYEILSQKNGEAFRYHTPGPITQIGIVTPCEGNVFRLYNGIGIEDRDRYYYLRAEADRTEYLVGLTCDKETGNWWYLPDDDPWTEDEETINASEAREIMDTYICKPIPEPKPVTAFLREEGETVPDPYAEYIAQRIAEGNEDGEYVLLDLDGDEAEELLINGPVCLSIYSQKDGVLLDKNIVMVKYVCEGNALEWDNYGENGEIYHEYFQLKDPGVMYLDTVKYDPVADSWTRDDGPWGDNGVTVTEAEAQKIIRSYKRLELDWKPLSDYPMD